MAALRPPVAVMEARAQRTVPASAPTRLFGFEPKWDGYRCLLFSAAGYLQSRRETDLTARFPEIVQAAGQLGDLVLDGELVALREGRLDFGALASGPRSRAAEGIGIYYVAFDLLSVDRRDLRRQPYQERREQLIAALDGVRPPLQLTPATTDRDAAMDWMTLDAARVGVEGVVAKPLSSPYRAGRTEWIKVRSMAVVDAVVVGVTGRATQPQELVLARPDTTGALRRIGLSLPIGSAIRTEIGERIKPTGEPPQQLSGGAFGRGRTEFRPVHPEVVVEVEAETAVAIFANRLRPRVHRVRTDLTVEDLEP